MFQKSTNIVKLFLLIATTMSAQKANFLSLEDAYTYALKHNYNYQKQELEKAITYEMTKEVITTGFPKINGRFGYSNNYKLPTSILPGEIIGKPGTLVPVQFGTSNNLDATLSVNQLIFDGRYIVGLQARESLKNIADKQVKVSEIGVKEIVAKSYFNALLADESVKILEENVKVLNKLLEETKAIYNQGLIEELDVERLQYNVLNVHNLIETAQNQRDLAYFSLKYNLGFPLDSSIKIAYDFKQEIKQVKIKSLNQSLNYDNLIEMSLLKENYKVKGYDLKQIKAGYLPSLYGTANFGWQSFQNSFNLFNGSWYNYGNFGLSLQLPIFDGLTRHFQISQAKLRQQKASLEIKEFEDGARLRSMQSIISLKNALDEYENQNNMLDLATKIQYKTQVKYKEGVGSSYEFAMAQSERIQQQMKVIQAMLNISIKNIEFKKAFGKL